MKFLLRKRRKQNELQQNTRALISLRRGADWSAPPLFSKTARRNEEWQIESVINNWHCQGGTLVMVSSICQSLPTLCWCWHFVRFIYDKLVAASETDLTVILAFQLSLITFKFCVFLWSSMWTSIGNGVKIIITAFSYTLQMWYWLVLDNPCILHENVSLTLF